MFTSKRRGFCALVLAGLSVALLLIGGSITNVIGASAANAELVFKRADGSTMHFAGSPEVWCGPWERGERARTIHIVQGTRRSGWSLSAVLADVRDGQRIRFPSSTVQGKPPHGALVFAYQRTPLIEASTNEEDASGSLVFSEASCQIGATVAFTAHAVLGSELFEGSKVRVNGTFQGVVAKRP
jgi:hypothetical protein